MPMPSRTASLEAHNFPCIDVRRDDYRYELNPPGPRCPKCNSNRNCLGVTIWPGYRVLHCALCGWQVSMSRRERAPKNFRMPNSRAADETPRPPCPRCNTRQVSPHGEYCGHCANTVRSEARAARFERMREEHERMVDLLIDTLSELVLIEAGGQAA